jgi:hypothetical protein
VLRLGSDKVLVIIAAFPALSLNLVAGRDLQRRHR